MPFAPPSLQLLATALPVGLLTMGLCGQAKAQSPRCYLPFEEYLQGPPPRPIYDHETDPRIARWFPLLGWQTQDFFDPWPQEDLPASSDLLQGYCQGGPSPKRRIHPRSVKGMGNLRKTWDEHEPIYYWTNLDEEFVTRELRWVFDQWSRYTPFRFRHTDSLEVCNDSRRCMKFVLQPKGSRCAATYGRSYWSDDELPYANPEHLCAGSMIYVNPQLYCRGGSVMGRWIHGAMLHEVGHALGLRHEHQRFDRGQHVRVHPSRVKASGFEDVVPTWREYRINRRSDTKVKMPMATARGPYNVWSIMHYWRKHKSKNGLTTISGAPSLLSFHMTKLQGTDIGNALAQNYANTAFLIPNPDFRSKRRITLDTGGGDLWKSVALGSYPRQIVQRLGSLIVPEGSTLVVQKLGKRGLQDARRFAAGMYRLANRSRKELGLSQVRVQARPAVSVYDLPKFNQIALSLEQGLYLAKDLGLEQGWAPGSMVVGSGLSVRLCYGDPKRPASSWSCERHSSRPVTYLSKKKPLASIEVQTAVTVWDDRNFKIRRQDDPRSVESFFVHQEGQMLRYRNKDREHLWSERNRSLYVPPGLVATVCPRKSSKNCRRYSNEGVKRLPSKLFDRKIDVRVYPAATLFSGEDFDDHGHATQSFRVHKEPLVAYVGKRNLGSDHIGSVILGPNLDLHLCVDEAMQDCWHLQSGPFGARASNIPSPYHEKAHYLHLHARPAATVPHSSAPLWHRKAQDGPSPR